VPTPIEQIKEKIDVAELIGSYIQIQKAGVNFKALCPFHSEKTPSFYISPPRQIWHCFGCNLGGDIFRFIMNLENIEFPEALKILAEKAGVELRREDPKLRSERTRLLDLLEEASRFYEKNLLERKDVGAYLKERGLTGQTAKSFRLGYALNVWDGIISYLKQKGYKPDEMEKSGLIVKSEREDGFYDRFRARIMFPLFDSSGRIVGFSGRIFEKDVLPQTSSRAPAVDLAKYINTPQTVLYDKSRLLYGFDRAKTEIRKQNAAVVLEGQMDLIMSHQAGATNAVAVSGTALTPFHLKNLRRLCDTLIMSFDMDLAGFEATVKSVNLALGAGFEVKVAGFPQAKDPADLIKENPEVWREILISAKPVVLFLLERIGAKSENALALKKEAKRLVIPFISSIAGDLDRAHWVGETASFLKVPEEIIWSEVKNGIKNAKSGKSAGAAVQNQDSLNGPLHSKTRRGLLEERLIGFAVWKGEELRPAFEVCSLNWFSPERRHIFESILAGRAADEHYVKKLALEAELVYAGHDNFASEIGHLAKELQKEHLRAKLEGLSGEMKECERAGDKDSLHQKFEEFRSVLSEFNALSI
jgi:DNA primase